MSSRIILIAMFSFLWSCTTTHNHTVTSSTKAHSSHRLCQWDVPISPSQHLTESNSELKYSVASETKPALNTNENEWDALDLVWPISGTLTSEYGIRKLSKRTRMHKGIDIGAQVGTPVYAAETGRVKFNGRMRGYGKAILLKHDSVHDTLYAHLSKITVKPNQVVQKNQIIGYVGRTGRTTGANLHFEMRINGSAHDPLQFLPRSVDRKKVQVGESIVVKNRRIATKTHVKHTPKS